MESLTKKVTLTFNLNDQKDEQLWKQLNNIHDQIKGTHSKKGASKGEILKQFIRPISEKDLLDLQKKMLSYQERIEIWRTMYGKNNKNNIPLEKFIVEVMPKLKEKDLNELEASYFVTGIKNEGNNVQSH